MTNATPPGTGQDAAKRAAARHAAQAYAFDGAQLGLGSGSTSHYFVEALAERVRDGLQITGVATSTATRDLATRLGIIVVDLDDVDHLDVCIDGFDEIDSDGTMIKGGGACLLWEKLVAITSRRWVGIADHTKAVKYLGRFPLPVEIVQFSHQTTANAVRRLLDTHGYPADINIQRREHDGRPVITDNGNYLLDVHLGEARDINDVTSALNQIPGVVENGFFVNIANEVVFGWPDGSATTHQLPLTLPLDADAPSPR